MPKDYTSIIHATIVKSGILYDALKELPFQTWHSCLIAIIPEEMRKCGVRFKTPPVLSTSIGPTVPKMRRNRW
jgi:hypothetical protein